MLLQGSDAALEKQEDWNRISEDEEMLFGAEIGADEVRGAKFWE
jgi:hypothetical protein